MTASLHRLRASSPAVPGGRVPVVAGTVRVDEAWTPYVTASLTCPATPELVDALDATAAPRIVLQLEQAWIDSGPVADTSAEWPTGTVADITAAWSGGTVADITADWGHPIDGVTRPTVRRTADLHVRHARRQFGSGLLDLDLSSDEGLLRDLANVNDVSWFPATSSVRAIVNAVLSMIGAQLQAGTEDGTVQIDATEWEPGVTAWEYLAPLVQSVGLRLWCDELRRWRLTVPLYDRAVQLLSLTGADLLDADDTTSRDRGSWYDAVVIRYEWRDTVGDARVAYDTASADGWSRVYTRTVRRPYPGPGAARTILLQLQARRRVLGLQAASTYTAEPGGPVRVSLPGLLEQNGRVSGVEWSFSTRGAEHGTMRLATRDLLETPPESWAAADPAATWANSPPSTTWANYAPPPPPTTEG